MTGLPKLKKTDAGSGLDGICRVIEAFRSRPTDPKRLAKKQSLTP